MATLDAIFIPSTQANGNVGAAASSSAIVLGSNQIFAINADGDLNIAFGPSGMGAAAATNFRIPAGIVATFDLGRNNDRIRLFNNTASTVNYWIQLLSKG